MRISDWSSDVCSSDLTPRRSAEPEKGVDLALGPVDQRKFAADIGAGIARVGPGPVVAAEAGGILPASEQQLAAAERRFEFADQQRAVAMAKLDRRASGTFGVAGDAIEPGGARRPSFGGRPLHTRRERRRGKDRRTILAALRKIGPDAVRAADEEAGGKIGRANA